MNRQQIESEYRIEHGTIRNPGKFEGEPSYAVHFYDHLNTGAENETLYDGDTPIAVFIITAEDRAEFPDLALSSYAVLLWERSDGFVETEEYTKRGLNTLRMNLEQNEDPFDDA